MKRRAEAIARLHYERVSDWPELMSPAFQFLLAVGGGINEPLCEGDLDSRDHRDQAAVETPLAELRKDGDSAPSFFHTIA